MSGPKFNFDPWACGFVVLDALLSILLAILLFIAGLAVMQNSPKGRRLHLIYAWVKIPLMILGAAAIGYMWSGMVPRNSPLAGSPTTLRIVFFVYAGFFAVVGLIYPICLLIALNSRGIREYYKPVQ